MGQILGLGVTHSPPLLSASGDAAYFHPHVEADRLYFDVMVAGDYEF